MFFSTEHVGLITGAAWQEGGGSWALVLASSPEWARTALDYVARSDEPNCCVSGSEVLRPLDTLGCGESVPPRLLRFFPSDWDTSLSTSLSACNVSITWWYFQRNNVEWNHVLLQYLNAYQKGLRKSERNLSLLEKWINGLTRMEKILKKVKWGKGMEWTLLGDKLCCYELVEQSGAHS